MNNIINKPRRFYSPLRYPGGKASLSSFFVKLIDTMNPYCKEYAEPYSGGAGAALTLLIMEKVEHIYINDFDPAIYAFWKSALYDSDNFIDKILSIDLSLEEWHQQKQHLKENSDTLLTGFAAFYLNRTNISGIIGGGPIGGINQTGAWKIDARFKREQLAKRIQLISMYKDRITLSNKDGIEFMDNIAHNSPNCFIYVDPPYYKKGSCLYLNSYEHNDHEALSGYLNNCSLNWILTYDNVTEILKMYEDRVTKEFDITYHSNLPRKAKEIMIFSDSVYSAFLRL